MAPPNTLAFEWSRYRGGGVKELEQKLRVERGTDRQRVEAKFDRAKNQTTIKTTASNTESKLVMPGLVLIALTTDRGKLEIVVPSP